MGEEEGKEEKRREIQYTHVVMGKSGVSVCVSIKEARDVARHKCKNEEYPASIYELVLVEKVEQKVEYVTTKA